MTFGNKYQFYVENEMSYEIEWNSVRRARRKIYIFFASFVIATLILGVASMAMFGAEIGGVISLGAAAMMYIFAMPRLMRAAAKHACPRCGEPFGTYPSADLRLLRQCDHCGLPQWSTDANAQKKSRYDAELATQPDEFKKPNKAEMATPRNPSD